MPIVFNLPLYACVPVSKIFIICFKYKNKVKISNI